MFTRPWVVQVLVCVSCLLAGTAALQFDLEPSREKVWIAITHNTLCASLICCTVF